MEKLFVAIKKILGFSLYQNGDVHITVLSLTVLLLIVLGVSMLMQLLAKLFYKFNQRNTPELQTRLNSIFKIFRNIVYTITVVCIVFLGLGVRFNGFKGFLNIVLYKSSSVEITILKLVVSAVTFFIVIGGMRVATTVFAKKNKARTVENQAKFKTLFSITKYAVYAFVFMMIIRDFGINLDVLLASTAALFVGIGMGMQQFFMDFISGIIILFDKTLAIGDIIQIENQVGKVNKINFRTTIVLTRDERTVIIPNHKFMSEYLYNWTQNRELTRFSFDVGVAYGSDTRKVEDLLKEVAIHHPKVAKEPKPSVIFNEFADSALIFTLLFYTHEPFIAPGIKSDLRFEIDKAFRDNQITIPFPQRDIHIISQADKQWPKIN